MDVYRSSWGRIAVCFSFLSAGVNFVASLLFLYNVASSFEVFDDEFWYAAPNGDARLSQRVSNDVHLFLAV